MSWKKTLPYFAWQSIRYAQNWEHFLQIWSYRRQWSESFRAGRNSVSDELPWLNFFAIEFLKNNIRPEFKVFEYGGGGSTLFFCKNVAEVTTVEDNEEWFKILTQTVRAKGYTNWKGILVQPESYNGNQSRSPENPNDFMSGAKELKHLSFEKYAHTINKFPDAYFDLILVDGRARPSCIQLSLPHLKVGGILIVDNTERPYYLAYFHDTFAIDFEIEIEKYFPVAYTPDFSKITIFRKQRI